MAIRTDIDLGTEFQPEDFTDKVPEPAPGYEIIADAFNPEEPLIQGMSLVKTVDGDYYMVLRSDILPNLWCKAIDNNKIEGILKSLEVKDNE